MVLLLSEREKGIAGSLRAIDKQVDCTLIARKFGGGGHKAAAAFLVSGRSLSEVKEEVLKIIREFQKQRKTLV